MNILKTVLSVGAGLLATAACYLFMSENKKEKSGSNDPQVDNLSNNNDTGQPVDSRRPVSKSDNVLKKLDKFQVGLINLARFISEVVRAISLFIRAMRCYECDTSYSS